MGDSVSPSDETQAVRLIRNLSDAGSVDGHQVKHPGRLLVEGARPSCAEDRLALGEDLGLDKQIAERRMQGVGGGGCEDDFRVTGDLDRPAGPRAVRDADPPQFDVIFR
jgi:hypothetical protein